MAGKTSKKSTKAPKKAAAKRGAANPAELRKALSGAPLAEAAWRDLTPIARRDFMSWIDSAKQADTRRRRIERACENLAAGKRRPCCYAVVPMDLYRALGAAPKAKAQWSDLTPNERRDFSDWIESARERETRGGRIEKACAMLAAGKRRPSRGSTKVRSPVG
jgi:uncharacterized protein YdeI (YjbR/CyaY-like superfamily)